MNIAVCDDQPEVLDVVENMLRERFRRWSVSKLTRISGI